MEARVRGYGSIPFPTPIILIFLCYFSVLIFYILTNFHESSIFSNIQATCVSLIFFMSAAPYRTIPYCLVSAHSPNLLPTSRCIRVVVSVRLNIFIRPDLINIYTSYHILSDTDPSEVCLLTSYKGFNLFTLRSLLLCGKPLFSVNIGQSLLYSSLLTCSSHYLI